MSFQVFSWRGEPIHDIHQWARDRGEKIVHYQKTIFSPWGPEVEYGTMPESFYDNLAWVGCSYKELQRVSPAGHE